MGVSSIRVSDGVSTIRVSGWVKHCMRLDLFLKVSRLCPRRTLAQQLCDAGLVWLNDRPAKSAHNVKAGDVIVLKRRDRETVAKVLSVPQKPNVSRAAARELIEVISDQEFESPDS